MNTTNEENTQMSKTLAELRDPTKREEAIIEAQNQYKEDGVKTDEGLGLNGGVTNGGEWIDNANW
ncbi:hypothetical protein V5T82_10440 [Magnetovibrio sp. PR-2]|uniref:hypothetical protein n=1 Tax=Magnetovibrio sp. PR-2 TaxID=3120356 RepID=UPI002FCDEE08